MVLFFAFCYLAGMNNDNELGQAELDLKKVMCLTGEEYANLRLLAKSILTLKNHVQSKIERFEERLAKLDGIHEI